MALAIFSAELLPQYFTENTRQDFQLSAGITKIASKGKSSRLHILKMRRIMAERWMERNLPRQVVCTAWKKDPREYRASRCLQHGNANHSSF